MQGERIVLCHSLACLLWLLNARAAAVDVAERVLLVAPPCTDEVAAVVRFRADGVTAGDVARAARETVMFWGEPDPYCPPTAPVAFAGLFRDSMHFPGGGHLNPEAGYGPFPEVERWALGAY
jgi:serine hydrolase